MSFRINSTGRKRIFREDIRIKIVDLGNGLPPVFSADIKLAPDLSLDPTARVYVEPYVGSSSMRFSFGTVAKMSPPAFAVPCASCLLHHQPEFERRKKVEAPSP